MPRAHRDRTRSVGLPNRRARCAAPPRAASTRDAAPFDASLETILFGLERRLAIVDGRIVAVSPSDRWLTLSSTSSTSSTPRTSSTLRTL
jgi:hypothetical protein